MRAEGTAKAASAGAPVQTHPATEADRTGIELPELARAPRVSVGDTLRLQRSVGNAAARELLRRRVGPQPVLLSPSMLQRMSVKGVAVAIDGLSAADARTHSDAWKRADKDLTFTSDLEILQLVEQSLSDHKDVIRFRANKQLLKTEPDKLIDVLSANPSSAEAIKKITTLKSEADAQLLEQPKGWRISCSTRDKDGLENEIRKSCNTKSLSIERVMKAIREAAAAVGLPSLDNQTVLDFKALESLKDRARTVRKPLDTLLSKYALTVEKILPGAVIVYRGSITRGVKSPKKYTFDKNHVALAQFDSPEFFEAVSSKSYAERTEHASYDCDANIEVPDKAFQTHKLVSGPLTKNDQSNPVIQQLVLLQKQIDEEIKKTLPAKMPGLDVAGRFEFFVNSASKALSQLATGTPYPPYMLEQSGMTGLAANLPTAYSAELVNKVVEYYPSRKYKGKVLPLGYWEPYFADLYKHIRDKGPKAVFMPEVQVEVRAGGNKEYTRSATPRNTGDIVAPTDLLAGETWHKPATAQGDVRIGAMFYGTVLEITQSRAGKPQAYIDIGAGLEAICFGYTKGPGEGQRGIFSVYALPRTQRELPVVNWEGV
jgi:hypothetical protein